jgi:hypothetical protein
MNDIATRLRRWTHAVDAPPACDLMDEAADAIERLRLALRRLAEQDATLSICDGSVTVTMDATLADEEREAIAHAASRLAGIHYAATLRGLMERTNPSGNKSTK